MTTYWLNGERSPPPSINKEDVPEITTTQDDEPTDPLTVETSEPSARAVVVDETRRVKMVGLPNGGQSDSEEQPLARCAVPETEPLTGNGTPHLV